MAFHRSKRRPSGSRWQLMSYGGSSFVPGTEAIWDSGALGPNITLSNGNRTATANATNANSNVHTTVPKTSGDIYWEFALTTIISSLGRNFGVGFCTTAANTTQLIGVQNISWGLLGPGGGSGEAALYTNNTLITNTIYRTVSGTNVGCAIRIGTGLWLRFNGAAWIGGGDPTAGTSPTWAVPPAGTYVICASPFTNGNVLTLNTAPSQLVYTAPTGYQAGWY